MERVVLGAYLVLLCALAFFTSHAYLMLVYYFRARRAPRTMTPTPELDRLPYVTVQLPMYNEKYVVERLLAAAAALDYPRDRLEIQVLDDSTDETAVITAGLVEEYRRAGLDMVLRHRTNRKGYKAGALAEALPAAKGEFVAVFDADFVPPPDFLRRTVPHFADSRVGAVQTRWGHLNADYSVITRGQAIALDGHFFIEQDMRSRHGHFITFNGTAGIWRTTAIADAGGWQDDTLTEDLDLSYRAQLKGWRIAFLNDVVCPSEVPIDANGLKLQQFRWAKGSVQTCRKLLGPVLRARLSFWTKFEAFIHLTNHFVYPLLLGLALLTLPLLLIKMSHHDYSKYFLIATVFTLAVFAHPVMYSISQVALYPDWKRRLLYIPMIIGGCMALSIIQTWAVIDGFRGRPSEFTRTPKYRIEKKTDRMRNKKYRERLSPSTVLELLMTMYLLATTVYAFATWQLAIVPFLVLYTLGFGYLSLVSLYQVLEDRLVPLARPYGRHEAA